MVLGDRGQRGCLNGGIWEAEGRRPSGVLVLARFPVAGPWERRGREQKGHAEAEGVPTPWMARLHGPGVWFARGPWRDVHGE